MTATTPPPVDRTVDEPLAGFALRAVPLVALGWLLGGWVGMGAAALGVASTFRRPTTLVAAAAPVALVVAALATVIEVPVDEDALRSSFANDRPTAATAGLLAGLFALVAAVTLATRDRARRPAGAPALRPTDTVAGGPARIDRAALTARLPQLAVVAASVAVVAVVLALGAADPPGATTEVADNVRMGRGWGTTQDGTVVVDGTEPPLAVIVAAVAPGGAGVWTALAGAGAAAAVGAFLARRVRGAGDVPEDGGGRLGALLGGGGRSGPLLVPGAVVAVGVVLVAVRADLAATLAAAGIGAALLAGDPDGRTPASAAVAGAAYGAAVLALPVLGLALPLVVAVLAVDPRTRDVTVGHGVAGLVGAVLVVAPWQRWLVDRFSTWGPAAEIELPVPSLLAVVAVLALATAPTLLRR